jgi:hypothetical protein
MSGGYVLDFSNREFEEFMKDVVPYNIYQRYPGMSKAKMLRKFIEDETDVYVGKMIILLINYMKSSSKDYGVSIADINKLYELGKNKLGKRPKTNNESNVKIKAFINRTTARYTSDLTNDIEWQQPAVKKRLLEYAGL